MAGATKYVKCLLNIPNPVLVVAADTDTPAAPVAADVAEPTKNSEPKVESTTVDANDPDVPAPTVKRVKRGKRKGKEAA